MESSKCVSLILLLLLLLLLPSSYPISFQIPNFTTSPNYTLYQGDAVSSFGIVELTSNVKPFRVGWVTYANEVLMWDSNLRKLSDFTCHFSFSIDSLSPNTAIDGIVFFLALVGFEIPPNSSGGCLGFFNITTKNSPLNRIIMVFLYQDLASATNDFSQHRKLGEGGFGAVYRGYLADVDMLTAVKKISKASKQGKKESEFLLVYEFMSNGSLDSHLFGKRSPFPWHIRYRITLGLASAILYLHEEWEQCVVHKDISQNYNKLAGTFGYLALDYISTRKAMGLVEWVWDLYGKGRLLSGVDERVKRDFDEKQAECLMIVGMWCSHLDSNLRRSIRLAIQVLKFEVAMPNLPAKMPIPMYHVPTSLVNSKEPSISYSSIEAGR
ncbi:hypothetical protein SLE2022_349740 [Rubroshorea leprosula]